jgi:hypothetical protein
LLPAAGVDTAEGHVVAAASVIARDDQERPGERHVDLAAMSTAFAFTLNNPSAFAAIGIVP